MKHMLLMKALTLQDSSNFTSDRAIRLFRGKTLDISLNHLPRVLFFFSTKYLILIHALDARHPVFFYRKHLSLDFTFLVDCNSWPINTSHVLRLRLFIYLVKCRLLRKLYLAKYSGYILTIE